MKTILTTLLSLCLLISYGQEHCRRQAWGGENYLKVAYKLDASTYALGSTKAAPLVGNYPACFLKNATPVLNAQGQQLNVLVNRVKCPVYNFKKPQEGGLYPAGNFIIIQSEGPCYLYVELVEYKP